jgi:hypothetical protein
MRSPTTSPRGSRRERLAPALRQPRESGNLLPTGLTKPTEAPLSPFCQFCQCQAKHVTALPACHRGEGTTRCDQAPNTPAARHHRAVGGPCFVFTLPSLAWLGPSSGHGGQTTSLQATRNPPSWEAPARA